uniref:Gag-pol polyprotein n=1 Tax=Steinernema glaseri TaxID=37863 RepID=A0A1I7ZMR7_9BILA
MPHWDMMLLGYKPMPRRGHHFSTYKTHLKSIQAPTASKLNNPSIMQPKMTKLAADQQELNPTLSSTLEDQTKKDDIAVITIDDDVEVITLDDDTTEASEKPPVFDPTK